MPAGGVKSVVRNCPCGQEHEMTPHVLAVYDQITAGLDSAVPVEVVGSGRWKVPRIYIACHGLKGADLPALAAQYGWEQV